MDSPLLYGTYNISFFDSYWVVVHFINGFLTGLALLFLYRRTYLGPRTYTRIGFSLLLLWEWFEVGLRYLDRHITWLAVMIDLVVPRGFFEIESTVNIVSDLIVGSAGLYLAYLLVRRKRIP